jgi:XTP/dITP diphosphohydrolase
MKIVFASNNPNKLKEIQLALGDAFELVSLAEIGYNEELPETGRTLESNALEKASTLYNAINLPVFADDSGLEVDFLDGLPGVDTAHYSGSRDADANMSKLLSALADTSQRAARFRTVIAYVSDQEEKIFQGSVHGNITRERRGSQGFGYDPIFEPEDSGKTFAEMSADEKSKYSHRVRALDAFIDYLRAKL